MTRAREGAVPIVTAVDESRNGRHELGSGGDKGKFWVAGERRF